jgi:hypothetical protein
MQYLKLKSFCTGKEMVTRLKRQPTESEKKFGSYISDEGLTRIYRGPNQCNHCVLPLYHHLHRIELGYV